MNEESLYLGEYDKLADLGKGGQSLVAKVRHHTCRYVRAVSILCALSPEGKPTPLYVRNNTTDENWLKFEERCGRLLRLCNGNHPNIVHCYQPRYYEHQAFFEMDYINGDNLVQYLEKNDFFLPIEEILHMVVQISDALSFCHYGTYEFCIDPDEDNELVEIDEFNERRLVPKDENALLELVERHRVIHNDISSKNIMRCGNGTYVLIDFGLSVEGDDIGSSNSIRKKAGHPEYKAPERWDGKNPSTQSDIYSFGIVLYECLTGHVPFRLLKDSNSEIHQLDLAHHYGEVPPILEERKRSFENKYPNEAYQKESDFDWLAEVAMRCLDRKPENRFKDGKVLHEFILDHLTNDSSVCIEEEEKCLKKKDGIICENCDRRMKPNKWLFVFIVTVILLGVGGLWYYLSHRSEKEPLSEPKPTHTISVKSSDETMGTVKGGGTFDTIITVTIEAQANDGYRFVSWNDGNKEYQRKVFTDHDQEYEARFEVERDVASEGGNEKPKPPVVPKFKIIVESINPVMGTVKGGGTYDFQNPVTIEAIANNGYQFVSWGDGNKHAKRTITVDSNQKYVAYFGKIPQPLEQKQPSTDSKPKVKTYWFGRYVGNTNNNGIPDGRGTMYYESHVQIAKYHSGNTAFFAEKGDYFVGNWKNGDIYVGNLYNKDGTVKYEKIKAKPRTRPYDLEKDEYIK